MHSERKRPAPKSVPRLFGGGNRQVLVDYGGGHARADFTGCEVCAVSHQGHTTDRIIVYGSNSNKYSKPRSGKWQGLTMTSDLNVEFVLEMIKEACGQAILIFPAGRNDVTDSYGAPFDLVPTGAHAVAVGRHSCLPFGLVGYLSDASDLIVAVTGPAGICSSVSVRIWRRNGTPNARQDAEFQTNDDRAVATVNIGKWPGGSVSGYAVIRASIGEIGIAVANPTEPCLNPHRDSIAVPARAL